MPRWPCHLYSIAAPLTLQLESVPMHINLAIFSHHPLHLLTWVKPEFLILLNHVSQVSVLKQVSGQTASLKSGNWCIRQTLLFSDCLKPFAKSPIFSADEAPCNLFLSPASRPGSSVCEQLQRGSFTFKPDIRYVFKPVRKLQLTQLK